MTDEKKGEKPPFVQIEKESILEVLPKSKPYSDAEALLSISMDENELDKQVSASGYIELWGWGKKRFYRFMEEHGFEIAYDPELKGKKQRGKVMKKTRDSKGTERGPNKSKDSKGLKENRDRKGTERGHNYKELKNKRTDTNVSVKDSKESYMKFPKKIRLQAERLLHEWNNSLQRKDENGKQRVSHSSLDSKVYWDSLVYFCQLLNGTFFSAPKNVTDPEFFDKIGVTEEVRAAPMRRIEIKEGLALLNRLFEKEYWGNPKDFYGRSLPSLILHPKGTSLFFQCVYTNIVKQKSFEKVSEQHQEYFECFKDTGKLNGIRPKDLVGPFNSIEKFYKQQKEAGVGMPWYDERFAVAGFAEWLGKQDWPSEIESAKWLYASGKLFGQFKRYIEEEKHVQFIKEG